MKHVARMVWLVVWLMTQVASAQTLPLPPGTGFLWEHVGDRPEGSFRDLSFDAGGTLWSSDPVQWVDLSTGAQGIWMTPQGPLPRPFGRGILTLGSYQSGGASRADTVIVAIGGIYRSIDGGRNWTQPSPHGDHVLYEIPAGLPHAGRLLAGGGAIYSDDRGTTWSTERVVPTLPPLSFFSVKAFLAFQQPDALPGAASGRDVAAPPDWPAGRIVAAGDGGGVVLSDDAGESYRTTPLYAFGRNANHLALVRRPDTHPLGPGPRVLLTLTGEANAVSLYASDDAGETWVRRAFLPEPIDGPGAPRVKGLFALSEPGEADPGAGGRALVVLARGHIYHTTDGGETWAVVGRAPGIVSSGGSTDTAVGTSEVGPDGRLYIGIQGLGTFNWLWRTTDPFVVAGEGAPATPLALSLTVRPNPAGASTSVVVTVPAPGDAVVTVLDVTGRAVATVHVGPMSAGETPFALDTSGWAAGVYVVRAAVGAQTQTARLVVAR